MYDGKGNRYSKTITKADNQPVATFYHYDKDSNIVSETDANNNLKVRYVRDTKGQVLEMIQGNRTYYYMYNGQDHITALTDESGSVVQTYSYDEYGNITNQTGTIYNPIIYTNYYWDSEVSLYHLKTRYYDPSIGRFLTRDKKGNEDQYESAQSSNFYIYAKNNPINMYDPQGKAAIKKKRVLATVGVKDNAVLNITMNEIGFIADVTYKGNKVLDSKLMLDWAYGAKTELMEVYSHWFVYKYPRPKISKTRIFQKATFFTTKEHNNFNYRKGFSEGLDFTNTLAQTVKFRGSSPSKWKPVWRLDRKSKTFGWHTRDSSGIHEEPIF